MSRKFFPDQTDIRHLAHFEATSSYVDHCRLVMTPQPRGVYMATVLSSEALKSLNFGTYDDKNVLKEVARIHEPFWNLLEKVVVVLRSLGYDWRDMLLVTDGEWIGDLSVEQKTKQVLYVSMTQESVKVGPLFDDLSCRAVFEIVGTRSAMIDDKITIRYEPKLHGWPSIKFRDTRS